MTHEEISKRAREIWEREGRPEGRDMEHWLQAEKELRGQSSKSQTTSTSASATTVGSMLNQAAVSAGSNRVEGSRKRSSRRAR